MRRLQPISSKFGFDRGTPVDRWYTDRFLEDNAAVVRGIVGEIADRQYTDRYGTGVTRSEVIDIDPDNPAATIAADLGRARSLPDATFDCLIVTQVLQYVEQPEVAIRQLVASLRPGGTLLMTVPALAAHDTYEDDATDFWRFWPAGLASLVKRAGPDLDVQITAQGNLVAAIAFLQGLCAEELSDRELRNGDQRFPVIVCARVDRRVAGS